LSFNHLSNVTVEKGTKTKCQDICYQTLPAGIPSSSPAPFFTQPSPPLSLLSGIFVEVSPELLILTWLTVWAKTIFVSTILAGKTTVLLLEEAQNVPDVIFLYHYIVPHIVIVQSLSPSLIFCDSWSNTV